MKKMPFKKEYMDGTVDCPFCGNSISIIQGGIQYPIGKEIKMKYRDEQCQNEWIEIYNLKDVEAK